MMTDPNYMSGAYGNSSGFVSKKTLMSKMFQIQGLTGPNSDGGGDSDVIKKNFEKRLLQDIEIDKMEVFSLVKQFSGLDG